VAVKLIELTNGIVINVEQIVLIKPVGAGSVLNSSSAIAYMSGGNQIELQGDDLQNIRAENKASFGAV
jgi:hypothetical protein